MSNNSRFPNDPHAEREAEKYDQPIPSREYILEQLEAQGGFLRFIDICEALNIHSELDRQALKRRLNAMKRDGQLLMNRRGRYGVVAKTDLVKGVVQAFKDGHGFVICDDHEDIYLSAYQMQSIMQGDEILVNVIDSPGNRQPEGIVVEVLQRAVSTVVGRLEQNNGYFSVCVENKKVYQDFLVPTEHLKGAREGQVVELEIINYPDKNKQATGAVINILGDYMAPGMEIEVAIRSHQIPHEWNDAIEREIEHIEDSVSTQDIQGRIDLRDKPFVTIDGEDAKDFDDAVYCQPADDGGWQLWVAIADVSHYVKPGSALDNIAYERGNSVYFPNNVIPMLPEVLSNGICSLKPKVDRLCFVCELTFDAAGVRQTAKFYEAIIHSHARLTYNVVADILDGDKTELLATYAELLEPIYNLHAFYMLCFEQRQQRGCIEFHDTETRIIFGETRKIEKITPVIRRVSHRIIEECMLAANVAAAELVLEKNSPVLYRNHAPPPFEKLEDFRKFVGEFKLKLAGGDAPKPGDFSALLRQIDGRDDQHLIETVTLRTMSQAEYSPKNEGHFGLAYMAYTHFTSPIRRYPDLHLHRALKAVLCNDKLLMEKDDLQALGSHCSMTERRADAATRDVVWWLKCEYMQHQVGQSYTAVVSSVTSFGLFVQLDDLYVEGLVHVKGLKNDYYHYDAKKHLLYGEFTGKQYRLGDSVKVRLIRVDMDERKIDFELANLSDEDAPSPKKKSKK